MVISREARGIKVSIGTTTLDGHSALSTAMATDEDLEMLLGEVATAAVDEVCRRLIDRRHPVCDRESGRGAIDSNVRGSGGR